MVKVSIDISKVQADLRRLSKEVNKTAEETIVEVAQIGATQLAYRMEPYGNNKKAQTVLEGAVFKDMSKAYFNVGHTYNELKKINPKIARAFSAAVNRGETDKAEKLARRVIAGFTLTQSDTGTHLESMRNSRGRVISGTPMGVISKQELEKLKAKKSLTAGTAKAGWLAAGVSIGSRTRIPKWLKKTGNIGSSTKSFGSTNKIVTLINHVKYASNLLSPSKINAAIANAFRNQKKKMERQFEAAAKKF